VVVVKPTHPKIPGAAAVTVATVIDPKLAAADEAAAILPTASTSSFRVAFSLEVLGGSCICLPIEEHWVVDILLGTGFSAALAGAGKLSRMLLTRSSVTRHIAISLLAF
jgi:hypothetical protein